MQEIIKKHHTKDVCSLLDYSSSSLYYKPSPRFRDTEFDKSVKEKFVKSKQKFGQRRIKVDFHREGIQVSRRRIGESMSYQNLVSKKMRHTKSITKSVRSPYPHSNLVNQEFKGREPFEIVSADTMYLQIGRRRHYLCLLIDIATKIIYGWAVSTELGSELTIEALLSTKYKDRKIKIFHSDRGSEFNNERINVFFKSPETQISLSGVANPLDNAVSESLNSTIRVEFEFESEFNNLTEFKVEFGEYVEWYNNERYHSSLNYKSPVEYLKSLDKKNGNKNYVKRTRK
jgi:transposase InsO family protein